MKYEYIELYSNNNTTVSLIDQVNKKGAEGFRLISGGYNSDGCEWAIMERKLKK